VKMPAQGMKIAFYLLIMAGFKLTLVLVIDKLFLEEVIEMSQTCCEAGTESHGPAWRPAELHSIQPSCL